jgi:hypothetical protein
MKRFVLATTVLLLVCSTVQAQQQNLVDHLQDISVTIKSNGGGMESQGSGVLVTRKVGDRAVTFVWTAGHVVDNLRTERETIDPKTGSKRTTVEFADAAIVKEFRQDGRRVGETKIDAKVLKYSDADTGEDLALLQVRKLDFAPEGGAKFYLDKEIPPIGTELYHVGSLLGQMGSNSGSNGVVFDQTSVTAFPGSSGGGVYIKTNGLFMGMLVRGTEGGFNLVVPIRRLHDWAKRNKIEWAVDPNVKTPDLDELAKLVVEDTGSSGHSSPTSDAKENATLVIERPTVALP